MDELNEELKEKINSRTRGRKKVRISIKDFVGMSPDDRLRTIHRYPQLFEEQRRLKRREMEMEGLQQAAPLDGVRSANRTEVPDPTYNAAKRIIEFDDENYLNKEPVTAMDIVECSFKRYERFMMLFDDETYMILKLRMEGLNAEAITEKVPLSEDGIRGRIYRVHKEFDDMLAKLIELEELERG